MQYSIVGTDGNQYGPVDLMTLKQWVSEGRVLPNSQITDNLSNRTIVASQMPELGLLSQPPIPPPYTQYPRHEVNSQTTPVIQGTVIGSVIFRVVFAVAISLMFPVGGIISSCYAIYYAIRAFVNKDPNGIWCLVLALLCAVWVGFWTLYKAANKLNTY